MKHIFLQVPVFILFLGLLFFGCNSLKEKHAEPVEELNRIDSQGLKQGLWEYREGSVLIARGAFQDGKEEGLWTYWYDNGQMKAEGHYEGGLKHGMWVEWYKDGPIMWKGEWEHGSRRVNEVGTHVTIEFSGREPGDHQLLAETRYELSIRLQNAPSENLYVEVDKGRISQIGRSDHYFLYTPREGCLTLAIGYIPDTKLKHFRTLVSKVEYEIK